MENVKFEDIQEHNEPQPNWVSLQEQSPQNNRTAHAPRNVSSKYE
jgi:hypothetical protein